MIAPIPFCRLSRRARVRSAAIVRPGVSSMNSGRFLQLLRRARERGELGVADLAHADLLAADLRLLGQHARRQLVGRHFEAEGRRPEHRPTSRSRPPGRGYSASPTLKAMLVASAVLPMPGRPARMIRSDGCRPPILALSRSIPVVMPATWPARVERGARGLDDHLGRLGEALDAALLAALFGDAVQRDFGLLDLLLRLDLFRRVERLLDHAAPHRDQRAQQREVVDLVGEIARTDQRRAAAGQLRQIGGPAQLAHADVRLEHRPQRSPGVASMLRSINRRIAS